MRGIPFVVDESPYVCWDWDLTEKNLEFLKGIDHRYFEYVAETNSRNLEGENKQFAAMSIRVAYSQAIETLLALLGALAQAPKCPLGWLLCYRNQLRRVVHKISHHEPVLNRLNADCITWQTLSIETHKYLKCKDEDKHWIQKGFGDSWGRFASDFLNTAFSNEYNSIKHGSRARPGGFALAVGPEQIPGVAAKPEEMKCIGKSDFGSSFFMRENIASNSVNFRPRRSNRNWDPECLAKAVDLAAMSINNVVNALRLINGESPEKCEYLVPEKPEVFMEPWAKTVGVTDMNMDTFIDESHISLKAGNEVLATYSKG